MSRQDGVYKDYTSNPILTSSFFKCNPSQSSHTIAYIYTCTVVKIDVGMGLLV